MHIALGTARFPAGTTGSQLDALARTALWQVGLAYDHGDGRRQLLLPGIARVARGSFDGFTGGAVASAGLRFALTTEVVLEPSAALLYTHQDQGSLTESGGGAANLAVAGGTQDSLQSRLGVRLRDRMQLQGGVLTPEPLRGPAALCPGPAAPGRAVHAQVIRVRGRPPAAASPRSRASR